MSTERIPPGQRPPASASDAAQRLATIVDAAERAAAGVIDDAEQQARRQLEEARERANRIVAERLRELADELDPPAKDERRAAAHLKPVEVSPEPQVEVPFEAPAEPQDEEPEEDHEESLTPRRPGSAGARLLATQMAVSGASRKDIEQRLRSGFEIDDTNEILDAILGPEA